MSEVRGPVSSLDMRFFSYFLKWAVFINVIIQKLTSSMVSIWKESREMVGFKVLRLNNPFIYHSSLLSIYYVPGIVSATRNPALVMSSWSLHSSRRQTVNKYMSKIFSKPDYDSNRKKYETWERGILAVGGGDGKGFYTGSSISKTFQQRHKS